MKKRRIALVMAVFLILIEFTGGFDSRAKADASAFEAQIIIESYDGVIISDKTVKDNAFEAVMDVIARNKIDYKLNDAKNYFYSIGGYDQGHFGGLDGWMYAVQRNGSYIDIYSGLTEMKLQRGDSLVLYYGEWSKTLVPNSVEFSTVLPDRDLTITINNYDSWSKLFTPIKGFKAYIDGKEVEVKENKIVVDEGLKEGFHTLDFKDFSTDKVPNIMADQIKFQIYYPEIPVRIEGLSGTLAEGSAKGSNGLEIVKKVLRQNNLECSTKTASWGADYISSIGGLEEKKFGGSDGWMYFIKSKGKIQAPDWGLDGYIPAPGQSLVIYYGDFKTPYVNNIGFTPEVVKSGEAFSMRFSYKYFDWFSNKEVDLPAAGAIVNIDSSNYITNNEGEIEVSKLSLGEHAYRISGYNIDKLPTVVMDKGVFTIDNLNPPGMSYSDSKFDEVASGDNNLIVKDIEQSLNETLDFIKSSPQDPWSAVSLRNYSLQISENFAKENYEEVKGYGVKDYSNTELEKLIMNLISLGYSPYNFGGHDLVAELLNRDINKFMVNDLVFAELAYKYGNIQGNYKITRDGIVNKLLSLQNKINSEGKVITGWSLYGNTVNPDITGMVLNALSSFCGRKEVRDAVDSAVASLSTLQNKSGYVADEYGYFSESISMSIIGLTSVGVNPEGVLFTKEKGDLVSALMSFKGDKGQFKHALQGGDNYIATEQALRALIALKGYKNNGKYDFYKSSINSQKLSVYICKVGKTSAEESSANSVPSKRGSGPEQRQAAVNSNPEDATGTVKPVNNDIEAIKKALSTWEQTKSIVIDAEQSSRVAAEVFELIRGKKVTILFKGKNISWSFDGMDLKGELKDVDLSLNEIPEYSSLINEKVRDVQVISFKNNGVLPGKAEVTVKLDENLWKRGNKNNLYLFYFNSEGKNFERVDGPLSVDSNNDVKFTITHCSDYVISDRDLTAIDVLNQATRGKLGISAWAGIGLMAASVLIIAAVFMKQKVKRG